MKINEITDRIDASYNTIKNFVEKNPNYYKKINNIIHVSNEGLKALENKYGVRSEVMSDNNIDFYRAQMKFLMSQLEEIKQYNKTFENLLEVKNKETELKVIEMQEKERSSKEQEFTIKELEKRIHQQELEKQEMKHELENEKNKSFLKKLFKRD